METFSDTLVDHMDVEDVDFSISIVRIVGAKSLFNLSHELIDLAGKLFEQAMTLSMRVPLNSLVIMFVSLGES